MYSIAGRKAIGQRAGAPGFPRGKEALEAGNSVAGNSLRENGARRPPGPPGSTGLPELPELPPSVPRVLLGDASVLPLAHRALARWALREGRQVVVDCGGLFDVYRLGLEARRLGIPAGLLLERILVCRAFTGYQEIRALLHLRRHFAPGQRITLLNPLGPLLDEDLPAADRPWLFRRLLDGIACFAREGYTVRVCQRTVSGHPLPEAAAFERTLARRFPLRVAARGRIVGTNTVGTNTVGANDGQERHAVFPRGGPGGDGLHGLPPLPDPGGSGALRQAV